MIRVGRTLTATSPLIFEISSHMNQFINNITDSFSDLFVALIYIVIQSLQKSEGRPIEDEIFICTHVYSRLLNTESSSIFSECGF